MACPEPITTGAWPASDAPPLVLHVEDDEHVADSVATLLRAQGYRCLVAYDGAGALAQIARCDEEPDVLILDFSLPGEMDGADVAQEICRVLGHVVPTIFVSGRLSDVSLPWLPGAPLLFAAKPLDPEVLVRVVAAFTAIGRFIRSRPRH